MSRRPARAALLFVALAGCLEPAYRVVDVGADVDLRAVATIGGGVLAAGDDGRVLGFDADGAFVDASTTAATRGRPARLSAISAAPARGFAVAGAGGLVLVQPSGEVELRAEPTPTSAHLRVLLRPGPEALWAAGDRGAVLARREGSWRAVSVGPLTPEERVTGGWAGDGALLLVTDAGRLLERSGEAADWRVAFVATASVAGVGTATAAAARPVPLFAAWAEGPAGVGWAVGGLGTALVRPSGSARWRPLATGVSVDLYGVTGDGAGGVVIVGARGTVLEGDPQGLARADPGLGRDLYAVTRAGRRVIAVGASGAWIERDGP